MWATGRCARVLYRKSGRDSAFHALIMSHGITASATRLRWESLTPNGCISKAFSVRESSLIKPFGNPVVPELYIKITRLLPRSDGSVIFSHGNLSLVSIKFRPNCAFSWMTFSDHSLPSLISNTLPPPFAPQPASSAALTAVSLVASTVTKIFD